MNELETRQAEFFDDTLGAGEGEALARKLELDEEGLRDFIGSYRVDRALAAKFQPPRADAIDAIMLRIEREEHPFVQSVLREIRAAPPPTSFAQRVREWMRRYPFTMQWASASAVVLALVVSVIWFLRPTTGEPMIAAPTTGGVMLERDGQTLLSTIGTRLQAADVLRTGTNATATITFGAEQTRLKLGESAELKLTSLARGKSFQLNVGKIEASVARQRPFHPMTLLTPQAEARVLGTQFSLSTTTNATRLEVTEGKVKFTRTSDAVSVEVPAGYYAVAAANYELAAQPLTGRILREYWTNTPGNSYSTYLAANLKFPEHPSGHDYLDKFEAPSPRSQDYGARIRGYLHPPKTGEYTFWIASGSNGELSISRDDVPEKRRQLGYAEMTAPHQWTKHLGQKSLPFHLVAGRKYFIMALYQQGGVADHLAVAWQGPDRELEVIPGNFLSPATPTSKENKQ